MAASRQQRPRRGALALASILFSLLLSGLLLSIPRAYAQSQIVNIKATVSGCTSEFEACSYGADHLLPGAQVRLIHPVNIKLKAGIYRISHAGPHGRYKGWRFNSDSWWVWNFGIALNKGGGIGELLYVAIAGGNYGSGNDGVFTSLSDVGASNGPVYRGRGGPNAALPRLARSGGPAAFSDTLTLPAAATLSFFILDYYVADNAGGVSLKIERLRQ